MFVIYLLKQVEAVRKDNVGLRAELDIRADVLERSLLTGNAHQCLQVGRGGGGKTVIEIVGAH